MRIAKTALAALTGALLLGTMTGAPRAAENWIGAWGFVALPLPPGITPPPPVPLPAAPPLDMRPIPELPTPPVIPPLIDNPGNVPVVGSDTDPATITARQSDVTIRQLVRVAAAGKRIRLRFTNEGGADALMLGVARVAIAGPDGSIVPGSNHVVTFDGHPGVGIPAGAPLESDPVDMPVAALDKLVVSIHVPGPIQRGGHVLFQYVAGAHGDQTAARQLPNQDLMRATALVSEVEVEPSVADSVVVTLGDSITEGALSTANAFRGWPDRLAERLAADKAGRKWSVVNAGIGGNRLLRYGTGPNALARLDRDVLSVPGVKVIILLEGINDIGRGFAPTGPIEPVTTEALEAADKQIIARAHEHGVKVIGATLTPYKGANYASDAGEQVRTALNNWIKTSGAFDGVVDFAPSVADPADPLTFAKQYNDRDHLHPNDAGYQAMANAIDLKLFAGK